MDKPTNTTAQTLANPRTMLFGGARAIEAQVARGAQEAVASTSLPSDISGRAEWEALGFVFGKPFSDDPLFCPVQMPEGWTKQRTDHHMHNAIVDANGNTRGSFFYKAAFYDRAANLYPPLTRYYVQREYDTANRARFVFHVRDRASADAVLFTAERCHASERPETDDSAWWRERDAIEKAACDDATEWLTERFEDWKDPVAYW